MTERYIKLKIPFTNKLTKTALLPPTQKIPNVMKITWAQLDMNQSGSTVPVMALLTCATCATHSTSCINQVFIAN